MSVHDYTPARKAYFPHRRNKDGTMDSICLDCYLTIATAETEDQLEVAEDAHICAMKLRKPQSNGLPDYRPMRTVN